VLENKSGNISETLKEENLLWTAYRKSPKRSFERYHPRPPTASPCVGIARDRPDFGYPQLTQEEVKLRTSNLEGA